MNMKRLHHVILMRCRCSQAPFQTSEGVWQYSMAAERFRKYTTPHLDAIIIYIICENLDLRLNSATDVTPFVESPIA